MSAADRRAVVRRALLLSAALGLALAAAGAAVAALVESGGLPALAARAEPGWLVAALGLMLAGLLLAGPRFLALLPPGDWRRPGAWSMGTLSLAVTVLNLSFPGPAGELAAALTLRRVYGVPAATALATSLHGRLAGLAGSGLLVMILLPLTAAPPETRGLLWSSAGLLGLAGLGALLVAARPGLLSAAAGWGPGLAARWLGRDRGRLAAGAAAAAASAERGLRQLGQALESGARIGAGPWARALGISALSHLIFGAAVLCCGAALGLSLPPLPALLAHCASVVASVALIILPGGLGAWDASFVGVLVMAGGAALGDAGLVLVAVRTVQVAGMAAATVAFMRWAGQLLADGEEPEGISAG